MKIAIMGTGGVGGFFGAKLAQNNDVHFIARGAHLAAMQQQGLLLTGANGNLHINPAQATDDPAAVGVVDLVLFCVKLYDTETAAAAIRPMMGEKSRVLTLQNGVDGADVLAREFGAERVWAGPAYMSATLTKPGQIEYSGAMSGLVFGTYNAKPDPLADEFLATCKEVGIGAQYHEDYRVPLWSKFVLVGTNGPLCAASRMPLRYLYTEPGVREVTTAGLNEVVAIARKLGVKLKDTVVEDCVTMIEKTPPDTYASTYHDLRNQRRLELDSLSGVVVRLGAEHGIATPVHQTLYAMLKAYRNGGKA